MFGPTDDAGNNTGAVSVAPADVGVAAVVGDGGTDAAVVSVGVAWSVAGDAAAITVVPPWCSAVCTWNRSESAPK